MKFIDNRVVAACAILAACSSPQQDWEEARLADTQQAYTDFLDAHPQGTYAERAQTRIAELERETAWMDAQQAATAPAYAAFLDRYPAGAHSKDARQRADDLARQAAWDGLRAQSGVTLEELRRFIASYPQSAETSQARALIAALEDEKPDSGESPAAEEVPQPEKAERVPDAAAQPAGGDFRVQLGAFRARETADKERARLHQTYGDALGTLVIEPTDTSPTLYRVRSGPMSRDLARETCTTLGDQNQACIVVAP